MQYIVIQICIQNKFINHSSVFNTVTPCVKLVNDNF